MSPTEDWRPDPTGRHEERAFSNGKPSDFVRDSGCESLDPMRGQSEPAPTASVSSVPPSPPDASQRVEPQQRSEPPAPEGWYPDPTVSDQLRYWNGSGWLEQVQTADVKSAPVMQVPAGLTSPSYPDIPKYSGLAIAALVLGLVPVVPVVGSILAIIFGGTARSQIAKSDGRLKGSGMATWGIVLGAVMTVLFALLIMTSIGLSSSTSGSSSGSATTHTIVGSFEVDYPAALAHGGPGTPCNVPPSWGNESMGDQVVISDGSGATLGVSTLLASSVVDASATDPGGPGCKFMFMVRNVPGSSAFYTVTIDGHSGPQFSNSDMRAKGWTMELSLTP
ncbi:MAG: DUF4190 domain-containing protein [Actinomycetes bacterium]